MNGEQIAAVVVTTLICGTIIIGVALQAWVSSRRNRSIPANTGAMDARLARMEQAIDTIALEVERIAEGQRFTTKLLSESRGEPVPASRRIPS